MPIAPRTLADLRGEVQDFLGVDHTDTSQYSPDFLNRQINEGIRSVDRDLNLEGSKAPYVTLLANTATYDLPVDCRYPRRLWWVRSDGARLEVNYRDKDTLDNLRTGTTPQTQMAVGRGVAFYTVYARQVRLFPVPTQANALDTLELDYQKKHADLVADTDALDAQFPDEAAQAVIFWATAMAFLRIEEHSKANNFLRLFEAKRTELKQLQSRDQIDGGLRLRPPEDWGM